LEILKGENLIENGDFSKGNIGEMPDGWQIISPNPALAPIFKMAKLGDDKLLMAEGNGRQECFGYVRHSVKLEPGKTYCMRVSLKIEGIDDLNRNAVHGIFGSFNDGIFEYEKDGEWIIGENRFDSPDKLGDTEIRLYFRFSAHGRIYWDDVSIQECEPIAPRHVKIAVSWGTGDMGHWSEWLDYAGEHGVDLALLPEMFNNKGVKDAELIDGETGTFLSDKARQWDMLVSASFYEKRGDIALNSAPLYDRKGNLVGIYSKNQLYDPEEDEGATPGIGFPVFDTDIGRIGIIICYDSWFSEPVRLLAYKGAELILFPNAGYYMSLMPARTADNGVWMAVSSLNCPAGIWDSGGNRAGEEQPEPTVYVPSSIIDYEKNDLMRMVTATVDMSKRLSPHWWGGPMRSAPGGRRNRQTLIVPIEEEIAKEAKRWWKE
jgi:predicted amidohydrolase